MARLIDAEKAWKRAQRTYSDLVLLNVIKNTLDSTDTVDAEPVVYGRWVSMGAYQGHKCGVCNDYYTDDAVNLFYCPRCGAKMVEIEKLDYRRKDMPIGAPWKKTVCEHGRSEDDGKTD